MSTNNSIVIKFPDIPRNVSPELYNYFIQLEQSLRKLEQFVNSRSN